MPAPLVGPIELSTVGTESFPSLSLNVLCDNVHAKRCLHSCNPKTRVWTSPLVSTWIGWHPVASTRMQLSMNTCT